MDVFWLRTKFKSYSLLLTFVLLSQYSTPFLLQIRQFGLNCFFSVLFSCSGGSGNSFAYCKVGMIPHHDHCVKPNQVPSAPHTGWICYHKQLHFQVSHLHCRCVRNLSDLAHVNTSKNTPIQTALCAPRIRLGGYFGPVESLHLLGIVLPYG